MSLTWRDLTFGKTLPIPKPAKTIEQKEEKVCGVLEAARAAVKDGAIHRCVKERGDDVFDISIFFGTSRIPLDDDGNDYIRAKGRKQAMAVLDLLQKETRAKRFRDAIQSASDHHKVVLAKGRSKKASASVPATTTALALRR